MRTFVWVFAVACAPAAPPPAAHPVDTSPGTCDRACANLAALGCPEGKPSRGGVSCADVCTKMLIIRPMTLGCVEHAETRAGVRDCEGVRCADE